MAQRMKLSTPRVDYYGVESLVLKRVSFCHIERKNKCDNYSWCYGSSHKSLTVNGLNPGVISSSG